MYARFLFERPVAHKLVSFDAEEHTVGSYPQLSFTLKNPSWLKLSVFEDHILDVFDLVVSYNKDFSQSLTYGGVRVANWTHHDVGRIWRSRFWTFNCLYYSFVSSFRPKVNEPKWWRLGF